MKLGRSLVCTGLFLVAGLAQAQNGGPGSGIPTPSVSTGERCGPGSVTFTATGCTTEYITEWYNSSDLRVGSGTTFTTAYLDVAADYFVVCSSKQDDASAVTY